MSDQELVLLYQDQIAGRLIRRLPRGELELTYEEEYLGASGAVPISTGMTLDAPKHSGVVLENWLAGLLPDDDNVLKKWRADFDVKISSPFGLLGTAIGEDCAGAFWWTLRILAGAQGVLLLVVSALAVTVLQANRPK